MFDQDTALNELRMFPFIPFGSNLIASVTFFQKLVLVRSAKKKVIDVT